MDILEQIDKLIASICKYTEKIINSDNTLSECAKVSENSKALAILSLARALCDKD